MFKKLHFTVLIIFTLRVLSSAIEPAVRFLQTLTTGCYNLQQDVVNKNSH